MPVKMYRPTTPGRRKSSVQDFSDITKKRPEKSLTIRIPSKGGRNSSGKITVRHRGGGVKQLYRVVDFQQTAYDIPAVVSSIEYDPNRGARIALVMYSNGKKSYVLAPEGLKVGDTIMSSKKKIDPAVGMRMPLSEIPIGVFVYNVELTPGKGGQIVRGAGASAQFQVIEGRYAQLRLPSGEVRFVLKECMASIGRVGNQDFQLIRWGKAGRRRHLGWRPTVKGKNMNPVDHPHGGGEGHSPIGLKGGPKTPWGKKARGVKTRTRGKWSNHLIIKRRK
ncbi:MAG: 50S ribosomal protein L2 [Patescibacteria group bacterium]